MLKQNVKLTLSAVVSVQILNYFTFNFTQSGVKWKISRFKNKMKRNVKGEKKKKEYIESCKKIK